MQCVDRIEQAMRGASIDDQVRMAAKADKILKESVGLSEEQIFKKLDDNIMEQTIARKIEGRNAALNAMAQRNVEFFTGTFDRPELGFESLLMGVNDLKTGSRASVAATQESLIQKYTAGFVHDIEKLGRAAGDAFRSGDIDDDIARALWQVGRDTEDFTGLGADAIAVAKAINKWQDTSRIDANEQGAFIRNMAGYITRQSHDMDKIRKSGQNKWIEDVSPFLDERTFDGVEDRLAFLQNVQSNLSTGLHLGSGQVSGFKGSNNVAKGMSHERVLHFKDADSWIKYNNLYGSSTLIDSVMSGLRMSGQNTGLMKVLGPNPVNNYEKAINTKIKELKALGKDDEAVKLDNARKHYLDNYIKTVTGDTSIPAHQMGATIGQAVRAHESLTKLGGAVISSIADIPAGASEMRYQGKNFFEAYGGQLKSAAGAIGNIGRSIANRKLTVGNEAQRNVMAELGVSLDATSGLFTSRFDSTGELISGRVSRAMNTFFRMNGLTLWTDSMRQGAIIGMGQHVGAYASKSLDKIPSGLRDTFSLYGIGNKEWDLIRSTGAQSMDGVDGKFLTPESVQGIKSDVLSKHLEDIGVTPSDFQIKKLRNDLEQSFRMYYVDRSQYAVIEPDMKTRATMLRDTQPGTVGGEFMRSVMQFKSFPFAIAQKIWGREMRGRESKWSGAKGMAEYLVAATFFGYIAMSAKDLAKNRTPRPAGDPKAWAAAFIQGGGAGLYGDFIFGDTKTRFGGGFVSALAGPSAGTVDRIATIAGRAKTGDTDAGKDLFRLLYQSAPAAAGMAFPAATALNAAYSKAVLDNLIYYNVMEGLSPGYKRRMERRLKKQNDQEILIK